MITQLEIKNFRGFSEYKLDDVGQVNLLVGTNNCGKTTVLEAIDLLKSWGDISVLLSILDRRGERIASETAKESMPDPDLCRFFNNFQLTLESNFSINSLEESLKASIQEISHESDLFENPDFSGHYLLNIQANNDKKNKQYPVSQTGVILRRTGGVLSRRMFPRNNPSDEINIEFVPASSLSIQKTIALFEKIVLTPDEELVLDALKIIEPSITRIASFGAESPRYRGGILVKSSKWDQRIPIGSFGDGIWRLLGLILSLVEAKGGTLLIDEIDTGLHHTVMSKMWKLICTTAKKLNVQVFATTHSRDCWETLADNAVEDEFADMPIRIHRINKDKKQATTFTNREMHLALNRELEVR